jgi:hypothetical protein
MGATIRSTVRKASNEITYLCRAARSSAELMGATIRSTVRKAARFAVYEEIRISEKNHHTPPAQYYGLRGFHPKEYIE